MPSMLDSLLSPVLPHALIGIGALVLLLISLCTRKSSFLFVTRSTLVLLTLALALTFRKSSAPALAFPFEHFVLSDPFVQAAQVLILVFSIIVLLATKRHLITDGLGEFEYPLLYLFAILGMLIMVAANDFLILFIGLEMQSLVLYILIAMDKTLPRASEAALKFFILGVIASLLLLYGISLIYGYLGTTSFHGIETSLHYFAEAPYPFLIACIFLICGLAFKFSSVPFHMWTPDVYEGARTPVSLFLASLPKVAAILIILRLLFGPLNHFIYSIQPLLLTLAAVSMVIGSLAAFYQDNIKRLLAYSAVSHMGYLLLGCASIEGSALQSVLLYLVLYVTLIIGVFALLLNLRKYGRGCDKIEDIVGLAYDNPGHALMFTLLLLSLAGIPPFAGFFAKLAVFIAATQVGLYGLVIFAALTSVISASYYLRLIKAMYFESPPTARISLIPDNAPYRATMGVLLFTVFLHTLFFIYPDIITIPLHSMADALLAGHN